MPSSLATTKKSTMDVIYCLQKILRADTTPIQRRMSTFHRGGLVTQESSVDPRLVIVLPFFISKSNGNDRVHIMI